MRIGFDAKRAFLNATGLGNYSRNLIRSLATTHTNNSYFLYSPKTHARFDLSSINGNQNITIRTPKGFIGKTFPSIWRSFLLDDAIKQDNLDIYHGLSHELPIGNATTKTKKIVTIHDVIFLRYPNQYSLIDKNIYNIKIKHACNKADLIIAVSEQTKNDIVQFYEINPQKIKVVYQSVNPPSHAAHSQETKRFLTQKYNLPTNFILSVGSIIERKNLLTLVKAFDQLKEKLDVGLVVVGSGGAYEKKVRQVVSENGLADRIRFLGYIPDKDLEVLYQMSDVFVYPSIYEGFGIPIVNALLSGVPVITSKGSCFSETAGPGSLYVDPLNDAELSENIQKVLTDTALKRNMIEKGKDHAKQFSSQIESQALISAYNEVQFIYKSR